jgi:hypothetical protein
MPTKFFLHISHLPHATTCPAHLILFDLIILIIPDEEYKLWSSLRNFLRPPVTSSLLAPNAVLRHPQSVLFLLRETPGFTPIRKNGYKS